MNDLQEIRDSIIHRAFPELMDEDIQIEYTALDDAVFECGLLTPEGFYIHTDETMKEAPREVVEGGLAHELTHLVVDKKSNRNTLILERIAYRLARGYKTLVERDTDVQTILRGYGRQLVAFLEYCEQQGFEHYKEDGLSIREIKALLSVGSANT